MQPQALVEGMRRGAEEGRVLVTSTHEEEAEVLGEAGLTGALQADPEVTEVGVYLNDTTSTTGSKLSYYLDYDADLTEQSCRNGRAELAGRLRMTSTIPTDPATLPLYVTAGSNETVSGQEGLTLFLLGPSAGELTNVMVDGQPVTSTAVTLEGRPGVRVELALDPNTARELTWKVRTGRLRGDTVALDVTPGVQPEAKSSTIDLSCG